MKTIFSVKAETSNETKKIDGKLFYGISIICEFDPEFAKKATRLELDGLQENINDYFNEIREAMNKRIKKLEKK